VRLKGAVLLKPGKRGDLGGNVTETTCAHPKPFSNSFVGKQLAQIEWRFVRRLFKKREGSKRHFVGRACQEKGAFYTEKQGKEIKDGRGENVMEGGAVW